MSLPSDTPKKSYKEMTEEEKEKYVTESMENVVLVLRAAYLDMKGRENHDESSCDIPNCLYCKDLKR